jgi:hypothetical protein
MRCSRLCFSTVCIQFRSPPAQKDLPSPVSTTARSFLSAPIAAMACSSSRTTSRLSAFWISGRASVRRAT